MTFKRPERSEESVQSINDLRYEGALLKYLRSFSTLNIFYQSRQENSLQRCHLTYNEGE
jgi:hypothetical protein